MYNLNDNSLLLAAIGDIRANVPENAKKKMVILL
jgi:hypothetical protein